jgi:hypothetical protein
VNELHEGFRQLARAGVAAMMWEEMAQVIVRNCLRLVTVDLVATLPVGAFATGGVVRPDRIYRVGEGIPVFDPRRFAGCGNG